MHADPAVAVAASSSADREALLALLAEGAIADAELPPGPPGHPLSDAQHRLWLADAAGGESALFNFPSAMRVRGRFGHDALTGVFETVVRRHHVLTAHFVEHDGQPRQVFDPGLRLRVPVVDLRALDAGAQQRCIQALSDVEAGHVFDLARAPLLRITLVRESDDTGLLLMNMHHIVSDGWSSAIFGRELMECLVAAFEQRSHALPDLPIQYSDYVYWQDVALHDAAADHSLQWWKARLADLDTLRLPLDRPRAKPRSVHGATLVRPLPPALAEAVRAHCAADRQTPFAVLLAAFKLLLSRYHGGEDIVVGTSASHRPLPELEEIIGLFVNQVVLRTQVAPTLGFRDLVGRVAQTTVDALAHREVPFDRVVAALPQARVADTSPLFQTLFLYQNQPRQQIHGDAWLEVEAVPIASRVARFDLSLMLEEKPGGLTAEWTYRTDILDEATVDRMAARFEALLARLLADPDAPVAGIDMHTESELNARRQEMENRIESRAGRFAAGRRRAVNLADISLVKEYVLEDKPGYPLVVSPAVDGVELAEWAATDVAGIEARLHTHGTILFRGFGIDSVERFEKFARAVCPDLVGDYGDLPKEEKGEKVYKSTPYPEDKAILFHNESSHTHRWPMKQFFSCQVVAPVGGETPIVDCRELFRRLPHALAQKLHERGLLYVRNFIEGLDVSWQDFFKTDDREELGRRLDALGIEYAWTGGNNLRTRQRARAVARHPKTGEWVFFNQLQLHHIGYMDKAERDALRELFGEDELPRNVYYGDGSPIEDEVIALVDQLYADAAVAFPWEAGDVLMVDNMITAHGRWPFKGPRKVIVAMGEMLAAADLPQPPLPFNG